MNVSFFSWSTARGNVGTSRKQTTIDRCCSARHARICSSYHPRRGTTNGRVIPVRTSFPSPNRCVHVLMRSSPHALIVERVKTQMTSRTKLKRKQVDDVLGGDEMWKHADATAASCERCNHGQAYFYQLQIRSADEPMTTCAYFCFFYRVFLFTSEGQFIDARRVDFVGAKISRMRVCLS
jgi:DNA-directed RNA polymerase subunit M/transcription elongation factor TFIIS